MKTYLAVDSGTSSIKAALFDEKLNLCALKSFSRGTEELDADEEWNKIKLLIKELMKENAQCEVLSISVSQFLAWVLIDKSGSPLTKVMLYTSQMENELAAFNARFSEDVFYAKTGRIPTAEMPALKLKHIKDNNKELYNKIYKMPSLKDYINYKLTGQLYSDYTFAGYTMVLNNNTLQYDSEIIDALGIEKSFFPMPKSCSDTAGYVEQSIAEELSLPSRIPVAVGGPDGSVGILGTGGTDEGTAVSIMGTTDVFFTTSTVLGEKTQDKGLLKNIHPLSRQFLIGGPMGFSGGTIGWLKGILGDCTLDQINTQAAKIEPGADGVLFIPGLTGERAPFWSPAVRGSITGLSPRHGSAHIFRAILEANSFTVLHIMKLLQQSGTKVNKIIAAGGGTNSKLWMQIKTDVLGVPIIVSKENEATLRGSAILAHIAATGSVEIPHAKQKEVYTPNSANTKIYDNYYIKYIKFFNLINKFYKEQ